MSDMDKLNNLSADIRLSIKNNNSEEGSVFGLGIARLCMGVRELGSLNAAAKRMGMAYSKAWRIIKDTETALDIQLLTRNGAHGSELTDAGNKILDTYLSIGETIKEEAQKLYFESIS